MDLRAELITQLRYKLIRLPSTYKERQIRLINMGGLFQGDLMKFAVSQLWKQEFVTMET